MVAISCGFGIFVGKELFGGMGQYVFHPALVSQAFLYASFQQTDPTAWTIAGLMGGSFAGTLTLLFGGLFLLSQRLFYWEIPLLFAGVTVAGAFLLGFDLSVAVLSSGILFVAFFIIPEPVTLPMTRWGARWYAVGAGLLILGLMGGARAPHILPFALLVMNALTPWIDARIRPRHAIRISEHP
jgi:electron transport complex protein RnfD